jgi:hypothetical protein
MLAPKSGLAFLRQKRSGKRNDHGVSLRNATPDGFSKMNIGSNMRLCMHV